MQILFAYAFIKKYYHPGRHTNAANAMLNINIKINGRGY